MMARVGELTFDAPKICTAISPLHEDRALCGWRVESELPLPDLLPWYGEDRPADLSIRIGSVPEDLGALMIDGPLLQVASDGTCRFEVPNIATYLVDPAGRHVTVRPFVDQAAPEIRVFLMGTVFALLCLRRGLLPLQASCVRVGNAAIALAGPPAVGKSTLAAAFVRRGCCLLSDDVTVVDFAAPGGPLVLPTFPRLKLWHDAMAGMEWPTEGLQRTRAGLQRYLVPVDNAFCATPLPLSSVWHIDPELDHLHCSIRRFDVPEAAAYTARHVYRNQLAIRLGLSHRLFPATLRIASIPGGHWLLPRSHNLAGTEEDIADILERMGA